MKGANFLEINSQETTNNEPMQRDFKGVWIPREIWLNNELNWTEKLLLIEIDSLQRNKECFATNDYFAKFLGLSKDRISKLISHLKKLGYIEVKIVYKDGTKQIDKRIITTMGYRRKQLGGLGENNEGGIGENNEDNNIYINNTIINNKERKKDVENQSTEQLYPEDQNFEKIEKETFDELIEEYTDNEELQTELKEHLKTRKAKKGALTNHAIELSFKTLDNLADNDNEKILIVQKSIENGWTSFFPLPRQQKSTTRKPNYDIEAYEKYNILDRQLEPD